MSLNNVFLLKIKVKISKVAVFLRRKLLNQFEKWCAIHASVGGVGGVSA